jgi:hypothetical protein
VAASRREGEHLVTRVIAIADSDSYLKWSAGTVRRLPSGYSSRQLMIANPVLPSASQIRAVSAEPVETLSFGAVRRMLRREQPEVVLLACTGPVIAALLATPEFTRPDRPVLVTGMPGVSVPASPRAVTLRAGCDLLVVHSRREQAEYAALADQLAPGLAVGLATLPFLADSTSPTPSPPADRRDLVFAAQAKVPETRADREAILLALAETESPVVKLRATGVEPQTHRENWPYPVLAEDLVRQGRVGSKAIRFSSGSMATALNTARGLTTVSSTAALEAMATGVPVLIISDFGVSADLINLVFADSGCLGTLDDLRADRLAQPDPAWSTANYFHPDSDNDWLGILGRLVDARAAGPLPQRVRPRGSRPARVRRRLRLAVPAVGWRFVRQVRDRTTRGRHRRRRTG